MRNDDYLRPTRFCDCNDPRIGALSRSIAAGCRDPREQAVRLFGWVRDEIAYCVGLWSHRASETLAAGKGSCTNKTNLLVALLRSVGIPAGYCLQSVKGQDYLGPIVLPLFKPLIGQRSLHVYGCVRLDGRWLYVDPSDDAAFVARTGYLNPVTVLVEWDGRRDGLLPIAPDHVLREERHVASIDPVLSKKRRNGKGAILKTGNLYLDFLRQNDMRNKDIHQIQALFLAWMRSRHPGLYGLFLAALAYRNIRERWRALSDPCGGT